MAAQQDGERRRFVRVPIDGSAKLLCSGREWDARFLDVSLKGALISRPKAWQGASDTACELHLLLGEGDVVITMQGTVAHADPDHLGFRCDHIGLESVSHLKRLLELNLGDERLLERELFELAARSD